MMHIIGLVGIVLLLFGASPVDAEFERKGMHRGGESAADAGQLQGMGSMRGGIQPSGLVPIFPEDATCSTIASPYASPTRYDGSSRPKARFGGLHGGIDITLDEKTPLLAIASGKVIAVGAGGRAEGNYIWLQHAPRDTGLPFWVYSKYQHLFEVPKHAIGDLLKVGDVVGLSGKTGTVGGHYGHQGYAHLHLTTLASPSDRFEIEGSRIVAEDARMTDPLVIFAKGLTSINDIEQLPDDQKSIGVSYVAKDGSIHPTGSRAVWPVACK